MARDVKEMAAAVKDIALARRYEVGASITISSGDGTTVIFTARKGALFLVVRGLHLFNKGGSSKVSRR
jgi:hypothetical protein